MLGQRPAGLDVLLAPPRAASHPSLSALLDLTGDQRLTQADGLLWALLVAAGGLLVLLAGYALATGLGWLLREVLRGVRWLAESAMAALAGILAGAVVDRRLGVPRAP
jgi:hypothetical protein